MGAASRTNVVIIGAGGHGTVLAAALDLDSAVTIVGFVDRDLAKQGMTVGRYKVLGDDSALEQLRVSGQATHFVNGVGSTADNGPRRRAYSSGLAAGLLPLAVLHPTAFVAASSSVSAGAAVLAGAIVNSRARIDANAIVNSGAIVEHDCVVGAHAHVATGALLGGNVIVSEGSHVGIGATVRHGICIGGDAVVGAGAVVVKDVQPGSVVMGVPAREVRRALCDSV